MNDNTVREDAIIALRELAETNPDKIQSHVSDLQDYLDDSSKVVRANAAWALGAVAAKYPEDIRPTVDDLRDCLKDDYELVRVEAAWALAKIDEKPEIIQATVDSLIDQLDSAKADPVLRSLRTHLENESNPEIREAIETAIDKIQNMRVLREQVLEPDRVGNPNLYSESEIRRSLNKLDANDNDISRNRLQNLLQTFVEVAESNQDIFKPHIEELRTYLTDDYELETRVHTAWILVLVGSAYPDEIRPMIDEIRALIDEDSVANIVESRLTEEWRPERRRTLEGALDLIESGQVTSPTNSRESVNSSSKSDITSAVERAEELASKAKSTAIEPSEVSSSELLGEAVRFADHDDPELRYQGTTALSRLFQRDGNSDRREFVESLDAHSNEDREDDRSILETIIGIASANLGRDHPGDTRGRAALTIGYIASKAPEQIPVDRILDDLLNLLEHGEKRVRRRRAAFALTYLAYYDAPDREVVRQRMADTIDPIRELAANKEKRKSQSVGLRALGFVALSEPQAVLPAEEITTAVADDTLRPRNRNRALRSLWQLGVSEPAIVEGYLDDVTGLLSYTPEQASETNHYDDDDLGKHTRWLRSNAAKTIAVIASQSPDVIDKSVINELIRLVESDDYASHRAILALGELSDAHAEYIVESDGAAVMASALNRYEDIWDDESASSRQIKICGYAVWSLAKLSTQSTIDWTPNRRVIKILLGVPDTERSRFQPRRTEAIALLQDIAPDVVDATEVSSLSGTDQQTPDMGMERDVAYEDIQKGRQIAGGGGKQIYKATILGEDTVRQIALKEPEFKGRYEESDESIHNELSEEIEFWERVKEHPYVVDLIEWGEKPHPWIAMEYMEQSLAEYTRTHELEIDEILWIGECLADVLAFAHDNGIGHTDLKPNNILLTNESDQPWTTPKIADWGLARFLIDHKGSMKEFTPEYAAPEQFDSDFFGDVSYQTDQYQLGIILYELLTGDTPFSDRREVQSVSNLRQVPPNTLRRDTAVPDELATVIEKMLYPTQARRYDEIGMVREELNQIRTGADIETSISPQELASLHADVVRRSFESHATALEAVERLNRFVKNYPTATQTSVYGELDSAINNLEETLKIAAKGANGDPIVKDSELYQQIESVCMKVEQVYEEHTNDN